MKWEAGLRMAWELRGSDYSRSKHHVVVANRAKHFFPQDVIRESGARGALDQDVGDGERALNQDVGVSGKTDREMAGASVRENDGVLHTSDRQNQSTIVRQGRNAHHSAPVSMPVPDVARTAVVAGTKMHSDSDPVGQIPSKLSVDPTGLTGRGRKNKSTSQAKAPIIDHVPQARVASDGRRRVRSYVDVDQEAVNDDYYV